jgi:hypothetical protein
MEQEKVINKVLRDFKLFGLIVSDETGIPRTGEYRFLLNALYVAAWEESRKDTYGHGNKPIAQVNKEGKIINIYRSTIEASKKTGYTPNGIHKALQRQSTTRQGWIWKYL